MHLSEAGMASTHGLCKRKYDCILKGFCVVSAAYLDGSSFPLFERLSKHSKSPNKWQCAICSVLRGAGSLNTAEKYIPKPCSCLDRGASHDLCRTDKMPLCCVCSTAWPPRDSHEQAALHNKENPVKTILEAWSTTEARDIMISVCTTDGDFRAWSH